MNKIIFIITGYAVVINLLAMLITISDKRRAKKNKWRIPEASLMLIGLFGGAAGEYLTMKIIRHKTRHAKFMVGLPMEIFFHIVLIILIIYKVALNP